MDYSAIEVAARDIGYRDKLRLAQLLLQLARREEEELHPTRQGPTSSDTSYGAYAAPRILKLRPRTRGALVNAITAMFQFRGGIAENDKESLVAELGRDHGISVDEHGRVHYPSD